MTARIRILTLAAAVAVLAVAAASAWKGTLEGQVIPIARAFEHAESGDRFVIEGNVIKSKDDRIYLVRDDSGEIYVLISDFLQRKHGTPNKQERIRVAGRFDHKQLEPDITGIIAQDMERLGRAPHGKGQPAPAGSQESAARKPSADAPAASAAPAAAPGPSVHGPTTSAEWKERLTNARQELLAAEKERDQVNAEFARALRTAEKPSDVDPELVKRQKQAEERVKKARGALPGMIEEARQAGVSPEILDLYVRATQPR